MIFERTNKNKILLNFDISRSPFIHKRMKSTIGQEEEKVGGDPGKQVRLPCDSHGKVTGLRVSTTGYWFQVCC